MADFFRAFLRLVRFIRDRSPRLRDHHSEYRINNWYHLSRSCHLRILKRVIMHASCRVLSRAFDTGLLTSNHVIMHTVATTVSSRQRCSSNCLQRFLDDYEDLCRLKLPAESSDPDRDINSEHMNLSDNDDNNTNIDNKNIDSQTNMQTDIDIDIKNDATQSIIFIDYNNPQPSTSGLNNERRNCSDWIPCTLGENINVNRVNSIHDHGQSTKSVSTFTGVSIDSQFVGRYDTKEEGLHCTPDINIANDNKTVEDNVMSDNNNKEPQNTEDKMTTWSGDGTITGKKSLFLSPSTSTYAANSDDNTTYADIHPPGRRFSVQREVNRSYTKLKVQEKECEIKILPPPSGVNQISWFEGALRNIITYITSSCMSDDYVGFTINYKQLRTLPLWSRFRAANQYTADDLSMLLSGVMQSGNGLESSDPLVVTISIVENVSGSGRKFLTHEGIFKRSIISITNNDNLCLPRSLVVAHVHAERGEIRSGPLQKKWKTITHSRCNVQKRKAIKLIYNSKVSIPSGGFTLREITAFQEYYASIGIAIVIFEFLKFGKGDPPFYDGQKIVESTYGKIVHTLYILYYERSRHFQPIANLRGALCCQQFCIACNCGYRNALEHRCEDQCYRCKSSPRCIYTIRKICNVCNRWFFSEHCFNSHLLRGSTGFKGNRKDLSICEVMKICRQCHQFIYLTRMKHKCYEKFCRTCCKNRSMNHYCYMVPLKAKRLPIAMFLFYDFETQQCQNVIDDGSTKKHIPNLCIVQKTCVYCSNDKDVSENCTKCGQREFIFRDDPVGGLVNLALDSYPKFFKIICIAHNASSFDAHFVLRYMIEKKKTQMPKLILNGSKIIVINIGKVIFIDSLNYLHMALNKLPKTFGFDDEINKGYFPHFFNIPENITYEGTIPPIEFYSPNTMFEKERSNFISWYVDTKKNNYTFNFWTELEYYCKMDVIILRRACMVFRDMFIKHGNVCPFSESTTIASACSKVFRKNFLKPDTIGILPSQGSYRLRSTQSRKAISWLILEEKKSKRHIIHAGNSKEFRLPEGIYVDGYYEIPETKERIVLQFHGCYWHGCQLCYRINRDRKLSRGDTMDIRYERTQAVSDKIRNLGYTLIEEWECKFNRKLAIDLSLSEYLRNHPILANIPLNPRDAFFGGRTENIVTLCDATAFEKIKYIDVCSLYPYICKTGKFPIGHPKIFIGKECQKITGDSNNLENVEGLVKCQILPPRNLFHPVLPTCVHGRLMFSLCRSCCEILNPNDCQHDNPSDRSFEGTWVVDEIRKAIELGYKILEIHEIWLYNIAQYNPMNNSGGIFTDYINTFLKIKQEASGWPNMCDNEFTKDEYIKEYERVENIKLDKNKIISNSGLRSVAKLCLNSFWGKFGQRENLSQCEIVTSRSRLMEMLTDTEIKITGFLPINNEIVYINYVYTEDAMKSTTTTNVVIAAYTTAQARLKLYSYLEKLGDRVLYCDTDSCIYVSKNHQYELPTGQFLGDMTNELEEYGPNAYIKSFVSGGPKFYAYIVRKSNGECVEVCKVKGITLNFENSKHIN